jgi:hypothetical protein
MRKQSDSILLKMLPFLRKNQDKRTPRDYTTLVENFKTRIQVE